MLPFLERLSPPLLDLVLESGQEFGPLAECVRLVPDLMRFELWESPAHVLEEFCEVLAQSPSLLPHLNTLIIYFRAYEGINISDSVWGASLRALAARCTQI